MMRKDRISNHILPLDMEDVWYILLDIHFVCLTILPIVCAMEIIIEESHGANLQTHRVSEYCDITKSSIISVGQRREGWQRLGCSWNFLEGIDAGDEWDMSVRGRRGTRRGGKGRVVEGWRGL